MMTDKQIIKEKGNQKCIFYNDDICRKGDKTRDCLNCARVEYHSLYKLNWENQERLESQFKAKEKECERLNDTITNLENIRDEFSVKIDKLKAEIKELKRKNALQAEKLKAENDELKKQACGLRPEIKYIINEICCKYNINAKYYHEKIVEIINNLDQIKEDYAELEKRHNDSFEQFSHLKAEKEELEYIIANKSCLTYRDFKCTKAYYTDKRLKQALTEIKDYCNKYPQNSIGFKKQILQKIDEVENGNKILQ